MSLYVFASQCNVANVVTDIYGSLLGVFLLKWYCPRLETLQLGVRLDLLEDSLFPVDLIVFSRTILFLTRIINNAPASLARITIGLDVQLCASVGDWKITQDAAQAEYTHYNLLDQLLTGMGLPNLERVTILKNTKGADGEWKEPVELDVRRRLVRMLSNAHNKDGLLHFTPE